MERKNVGCERAPRLKSRNPWPIPLIEPYIISTCQPGGVLPLEGALRSGEEIPGQVERGRSRKIREQEGGGLVLVEFSVIPVGGGESIGGEIAKVLDIVDKSGLRYQAGSMGTVIEGEWDEVMSTIRQCHEAVRGDGRRVFTSLTMDDRPGKADRITEKLASVERRLGRSVNR
jgi:uncharacterized protein (TIGR00106 family)